MMTYVRCTACRRAFTVPQQYVIEYGIVKRWSDGIESITDRAYCRTRECRRRAESDHRTGIPASAATRRLSPSEVDVTINQD
jgi:hypothetical protein